VNFDIFDIGSIADGGFFIKFHLRIKIDGFQWFFVAVYGAAQLEFKENSLRISSCMWHSPFTTFGWARFQHS
jgi:hypothetical protein